MGRLVIGHLLRYYSTELHKLFRGAALDEIILQAEKRRESNAVSLEGNVYFAGVLLSSIIWPLSSPSRPCVPLIFFAWTLTMMRAGFRRPTLTNSERASASVIVALNKPVRRCFGRWVIIRVREAWNPKSRSLSVLSVSEDSNLRRLYLSASSNTRTSKLLTFTTSRPFPKRNSSIRPGVPTMISAPVERNLLMSSAGEDCSEETSNKGGGNGVESSVG